MKQRIITAIFFGIAMIGGIYGGRYTFEVLILIITGGSLWELMSLVLDRTEKYFRFRRTAGVLLGLLPVWLMGMSILEIGFCGLSTPEERIDVAWEAQFLAGSQVALLVGLAIFILFLTELFTTSKTPFANIGAYLLGVFYISFPLCLLILLVSTAGVYYPNRVFGLLVLVWVNDVVAYFVGSQLGRTKLFERISPKKTWEGTLGGVVGTVATAGLISIYIPDFTQTQWLALGAVVAIFGTLGDLIESMLKRSVGVKDSGNLLPGHGGLLDRFDAFFFVLPFAWLVVTLL